MSVSVNVVGIIKIELDLYCKVKITGRPVGTLFYNVCLFTLRNVLYMYFVGRCHIALRVIASRYLRTCYEQSNFN